MNSLFSIRQLRLSDISTESGFFEALAPLNDKEPIDYEKAKNIFNKLEDNTDHYIYVAEMDSFSKPIIGTATLRIDRSFLHNCVSSGRIENVSVKEDFRGIEVASALVNGLIWLAEEKDCYKITLSCKNELISFYERLGFHKHENEMRINTIKDKEI